MKSTKKKIIGIVILMLLGGCGNKVDFTTEEYKEKMVREVLVDKDKKSIIEYNKILSKLEKQAKNNKEAMDELERWKSETSRIQNRINYNIELRSKTDEQRRREFLGI